ncbi:transporter substrate-binding domain-containing protein [Agrobacterium rubi]|uniref:Transporter substrate-binding domain-containing protein n=1 Tax=Agrobacterium rubi TaxID=28099 RepID=A0AAE7R0U0_9HYPH|nr:transporter substrate-binding domain-containing protein [Agrobacterium rubi]NTF03493.1 transporter substrate-binding domain-containing protein [Agrobacterium rubi]NTF37653.1 transporter substrate-binding domain-containing protein [Agrobacterium rubi]QTG00183.1 transporter substrate-binding domain-containing protein [Agrobacterium rubi]
MPAGRGGRPHPPPSNALLLSHFKPCHFPAISAGDTTLFRRSFFITLAAAILSPAISFAADLPDLKGKTVVVVTENAYPPLQFVDPASGKAIGWEYDAMAEIAKRLNFKVEYQNTSWDAMIQAVSDGQYDIGMTGISIKEERKQKVDFSDPYMRSEMFMLVRADETRFTDAKSFAAFDKGLVGAQAGTTPFYTVVYDVLDGNEQNPRVKLMETFGATVQALKTGDVDLVLTDGVAGKGYVDASGGTLKLIGGPLGGDDFGFIFKKGSDLVAPVNAAIAALKADGTFAKLDKTWFLDYKLGQ